MPWYSAEVCAAALRNLGSSAMPSAAAASAHCVLRCSVGTTTVIVSMLRSASSSVAIRRANAVLPAPGVATSKKSRGLAVRYRTKARRCQPRKAWVLGASLARTRRLPPDRDAVYGKDTGTRRFRRSCRPTPGANGIKIGARRQAYCQIVITGLAHSGVCVPDCEAAVVFYRDVLGMRVLSPPYVMAGDAIRDDMGELVSDPTMKAAIVGFDDDGDRVLEVIEYLGVAGGDRRSTAAITDHGLSHGGLICEDLAVTRAELEAKGVRFLVDGIADVARVRTTWFVDPWGVVFILVEKSKPDPPYL